jgi:hypothetical protein
MEAVFIVTAGFCVAWVVAYYSRMNKKAAIQKQRMLRVADSIENHPEWCLHPIPTPEGDGLPWLGWRVGDDDLDALFIRTTGESPGKIDVEYTSATALGAYDNVMTAAFDTARPAGFREPKRIRPTAVPAKPQVNQPENGSGPSAATSGV